MHFSSRILLPWSRSFVARCSPARRRGYAKATACLSALAGLDSLTAPAAAEKDNYNEKYKDTNLQKLSSSEPQPPTA